MAALTRETLLARAEALIPTLRERASEAESLRRIPDATIADLIESGLIRATLPSRLGGAEVDYRTMMEIVALVARGCGSTGWVYCNLASCCFKLALWPERAQDEIWGEDLDALLTGSLIFPCGKAERVEGGYRLSGRWPFGSGIDHACANFFAGMVTNAEPNEFRIFLVPKGEYTIIDTWHTSGLRGTGSKDAAVEDVFVPEYRTIDALDTRNGAAPGNAVNTGTVYRLPLFSMFFTWVGATVLGIAEAAVENYVEATRTRVANYSGARVADYSTIHVKIAEARAAVAAARRLYLGNCDEATAIGDAGDLPSADARARYRAEGAYAAKLCCQAVDLITTASGGGGIYDRNPLSRAFRDIHAGSAHITQTWDPNAVTYGRLALGLETDNPLL
jgi:3-hydroxy-9,10-secoandrosta-1,3,5(10)-triene-9,17-dione monooxygenase